MKEYLQKYLGNFKEKPLKLIGTVITYLGIALIVVPALLANIGLFSKINLPDEVFYAFFIMVIVGPFNFTCNMFFLHGTEKYPCRYLRNFF